MKRLTPERRLEWAWILYDVGNSAFTLILSAILPLYFNEIAAASGISKETAGAYWGYGIVAATLCVAVLSPVLGTLSDCSGYKKPIFFFFAFAGVLGCAALGIPMPWVLLLAVSVIARVLYASSLVYYDSMLVDVTTPARSDIVSSKGYAFGYVGSCIPFVASIAIIYSGLESTLAMGIAMGLNAAWWLAFTLPLMKCYRQTHFVPRTPHAVRDNFKRLFSVFSKKSDIPNKKGIVLFLVAFFLYIDGVYTIIDMATTFGKVLFGESGNVPLVLALLLTQIIAFPAAILFGKLAKRARNDVLIGVSILAYTGVALFAVFMHEIWQFWVLACVVGMFQGGVQALSRSYFSKIIPAEQAGCLFGILDIFGKGASVFGMLLTSVVMQVSQSANLAAIPIVCLFVAGSIFFVLAARINRPYLDRAETESPAQPQPFSQTQS